MKFIREYGSTIGILLLGAVLILLVMLPREHPLDGQIAPTFQLAQASGGTVDLTQHIGKDVIVLDFWATWCPPCREGLPIVDAVAKHFADKPVAVYAVNIAETPEQVKAFVDSAGLTLPVLMDDGEVATEYGVTGIPQTVVIDKAGMIHKIHVGMSGNFEAELKAEVQSLLGS